MINTQIRLLLKTLAEEGETVAQDGASLLKNDNLLEALNTQLILTDSRIRIFFSPASLEMFNPGLAVARFFYLLSGSNLLKDIGFYTKGVERFSDDGIHVPGSSYGFRIFNSSTGSSQYDRTLALLSQKRNTKRAAISIYNETDCGRVSKDIPCCMSLIFSPRGETLNFTVHMRANNIWSLTAYNIFEFSLLFEFIASLTGYKLGTYFHLSTSTHFSVTKLGSINATLNETPQDIPFKTMPPVDSSTRSKLVQLEKEFRAVFNQFLLKPDLQQLIALSKELTAGLDPYWADFYFTLANYFLAKNGFQNECKKYSEQLMQESHVLLPFQLRWMNAAQNESAKLL